MLTLKQMIFDVLGVKKDFSDATSKLTKRLLDIGIYDISDVECLILEMSLEDILPEEKELPLVRDQKLNEIISFCKKNYTKVDASRVIENKTKFFHDVHSKQLEKQAQYRKQLTVFFDKYKDTFRIAYKCSGEVIFILSQDPSKYNGKYITDGYSDEGFVSLFDFSEMAKKPTKLLIVE